MNIKWNDVIDLRNGKRIMVTTDPTQADELWGRMKESRRLRKKVLNHIRKDVNYYFWKKMKR